MRGHLFALLFFFALSLSHSPSYGQVTAIKAGRLVDPGAGTGALNQVILVEKVKITAVGGNVAGQTRGTEAISGIDMWVEAGIPPRVILQALTANAARLL